MGLHPTLSASTLTIDGVAVSTSFPNFLGQSSTLFLGWYPGRFVISGAGGYVLRSVRLWRSADTSPSPRSTVHLTPSSRRHFNFNALRMGPAFYARLEFLGLFFPLRITPQCKEIKSSRTEHHGH